MRARKEPLTQESAPAAARRWLARRDYSQQELLARLLRNGLPQADAEALVAELADGWWQSDQRFALMLIRTRARQGKGPRMVAAELAQHGLSRAEFSQACDEAEVDWSEAAAEALRRTQHADPVKLKQLLSRKGFDSDQIRAALADYCR